MRDAGDAARIAAGDALSPTARCCSSPRRQPVPPAILSASQHPTGNFTLPEPHRLGFSWQSRAPPEPELEPGVPAGTVGAGIAPVPSPASRSENNAPPFPGRPYLGGGSAVRAALQGQGEKEGKGEGAAGRAQPGPAAAASPPSIHPRLPRPRLRRAGLSLEQA